MNLIKNIFSYFFLVFLILNINAQEMPFSPVVPPSPDASMLGRFGEYPVSLYTGLPQINVPVYALKGKDISVSISLSYHASGIKKDEEPGILGNAWALNAGGVITRVMRGKADALGTDLFGCYSDDPTKYTPDVINMMKAYHSADKKDGEPDLFYFNFNGHTGKFILNCADPNGSVIFLEHSNIKIQPVKESTSNQINNWIVTDENGVVYNFSEKETTGFRRLWYMHTSPPSIEYTSAWYLSTMTSVVGEQITFTYLPGRTYEKTNWPISQTGYIDIISSSSSQTGPPCQVCFNLTFPHSENTCHNPDYAFMMTSPESYYSEYNYSTVNLSSIQSINGSVGFTYTEESTGYKWLSRININNNTGLIKYFKIDVDEAGAFGISAKKLNYIQEYNINNVSIPPYAFTYNFIESNYTDNWGYPVPVTSPETDTWTGYYPWAYYEITATGINELQIGTVKAFNWFYDDEIRTVPQLSRIDYPTGGYTLFEFEPNDFAYVGNEDNMDVDGNYAIGKAGGMRISLKKDYDNTGTCEVTRYTYKNHSRTDYSPLSSSGVLLHRPIRSTIQYKHIWNTIEHRHYLRPFFYTDAESILPLSGELGGVVGYREVGVAKVKLDPIGNEMDNNGLTLYVYDSPYEFPDQNYMQHNFLYYANEFAGWSTIVLPNPCEIRRTEYSDCNLPNFPFAPTESFEWKRGKLKEKYVVNKDHQLVKKVINNYTTKNEGKAVGIICTEASSSDLNVYYSFYKISYGTRVLENSNTTEYFYESGTQHTLATTESFEYNTKLLPSKITKQTSIDNIIQTKKYAYEDNTSLETKNILSPVAESKSYKNSVTSGNLLKTTSTTYNDYGNPVTVEEAKGSNSLENKITYTFNSFQNLVSVQKTSDIPVSYYWDYDKCYPVIKAGNVSNGQLVMEIEIYENIFPLGVESFSQITEPSKSTTQNTWLKQIHSNLKTLFPNGQISVYTYKPLVGMTSETDPNGKTTYYEYDSFGRLQYIKDQDLNIIQEYNYNYKQE